LDDEEARSQAFEREKDNTLYFALWAAGFEDAIAALAPAAKLLSDKDEARRLIGTLLVGRFHLLASEALLLPVLDDSDLRIALTVLDGWERKNSNYFEPGERLLARMPKKKTLLPHLFWKTYQVTADRKNIAGWFPSCLGDRPATRLISYLPIMS